MAQPNSVSIPIQHLRRVHEIEARCVSDPDEVTLLELIEAVAEYSQSEREVVATVMHMLQTGAVQLSGTYSEPAAAKLCG